MICRTHLDLLVKRISLLKLKPSISTHSKPCNMPHTLFLKCFVFISLCYKTKHFRSLIGVIKCGICSEKMNKMYNCTYILWSTFAVQKEFENRDWSSCTDCMGSSHFENNQNWSVIQNCPIRARTPITAMGCRQCLSDVLSKWKINFGKNTIAKMALQIHSETYSLIVLNKRIYLQIN